VNRDDPLLRLQQVFEALADISAEADGVDDLMRRVVRQTMRFTGATGAVVEQVDGDELVYVCADGSIAAHVGLRLQRRGSLSGLATVNRQIQRCDDSETDPRVNREACRVIRARSMLIVPLVFGDRVIGVLKATSERPAAFGPLDQQAMQQSAGIIAAALGRELKQAAVSSELDSSREQERALRRQVMIDALTGLPNRRQFEQWLGEVLGADPAPGTLGLLFLDLNQFKPINDRYGHEVGDAALRRLAELLRSVLPESCRVARLAGDEFVVLANALDDAAAQLEWLARKLLAVIDRPQSLGDGVTLTLSVSIGGAVFDRRGLTRTEWLSRADSAMYAAKKAGDNQFRLHPGNADGGSAQSAATGQ